MTRNRSVQRVLLVFIGIAVLSLGVVNVSAAAENLPDAMTILMKNIEARGGFAAIGQINNWKVVYHGESPWHNSGSILNSKGSEWRITTETTIYQEKPNHYYSRVDVDWWGGLGAKQKRDKLQYGTDGQVVWKMVAQFNQNMRPEVIVGEDRANTLVDFHFPFDLQQSPYKSFQTVGVKTIDGKACYEVTMKPSEGDPKTAWFDKDSFLLMAVQSSNGNIFSPFPQMITFSDYRKVSGVMVAHKMEVLELGRGTDTYPLRMTMNIKSIEMNIAMPKDRFELPPQIKALLDE
jgi:hypothetical protein